jgi:hypothetical protein
MDHESVAVDENRPGFKLHHLPKACLFLGVGNLHIHVDDHDAMLDTGFVVPTFIKGD